MGTSGGNSGGNSGGRSSGAPGVRAPGTDGNTGGSGGTGPDGRGRLTPEAERQILAAYEAWDGHHPRLDELVAGFGISRPTLYAVLRRYGRPTKREFVLIARDRARSLDPDPPTAATDGPDPRPDGDGRERRDAEIRRLEREARRWQTEADRLRRLLEEHGIDDPPPDDPTTD